MHDESRLTERVLSGSADPADWEALEELAQHDSQLWWRLAMSLRDQNELGLAVRGTAEIAESIALTPAVARATRRARPRRVGTWLGWAAAACLAMFWLTGQLPTGPRPVPAQAASMDEALELYRAAGSREGRLVRELPLLMVERQPVSGGQGSEVIYVRRLVERRQVRDVYESVPDEWGGMVAVPASQTADQPEEI
jgi:hypothetical protein